MTPRVALAEALVALAVVCFTTVRPGHAAVIPAARHAAGAPEVTVPADLIARGASPPPALTSEAFRAPQPTSAGPGSGTSPPTLGTDRAGARGLAAPRAEPALDAQHALAHAAHLDPGSALEPAHALLRVAGAGQQPGLHQQLGVAQAQARAADSADKASPSMVVSAEDKDKGLLQAIVAALQGGDGEDQQSTSTSAPTTEAQPEALSPPDEPEPPSHPVGQVRPTKVPRLSDSLLPGLVQVLNHLVDLVEEREQVVEAPATTTTAAPYVMETVAVPPAPAEPTIEVTVVSSHKPSKPETSEGGEDANEVIISGPLAGIASLLSAVAGAVAGTPGTASVSIVENTPVKNAEVTTEAVTEAATQSVSNTVSEAVTEAVTEAATEAVTEDNTEIVIQDISEPTIAFVNKDVTETGSEAAATTEATVEQSKEVVKDAVTALVKDAVEGVVADAVKGVVKEAIKEALHAEGKNLARVEPVVILDDDEDMQEDMPVVQSDVPVVNEEMVPMTMMMSMVMDDAGPLSFDLSPAEDDDALAVPGRTRRAADIFPDEFKSYVEVPTADRQDDDGEDTTTAPEDSANDIEDDAVLALPQYRGEAAAVGKKRPSSSTSSSSEVSPSLLALVKLRYALTAEAKRQNFKSFQGFSERVLDVLVRTSSLTGREQLGALLAGVLDEEAIKFPKTLKRATAVLRDLEDDASDLSKTLQGIPALKYSP